MRRLIFTEEQEAFRASVRAFFEREAVPHVATWEAERMVPRAFWRRAAEQGLVGFDVPTDYGGPGLDDFRFNVIVSEEACRSRAIGDNLALQNDVICGYVVHLGTEDQKERWLRPFVRGELLFAIAMTEPAGGSDLRGMATTARTVEGGYVVNGSKTFITAGMQADLVIVAARVSSAGGDERGGLCLLGVDAGSAGFSRGRRLEKIGRHAQDTAELFFDDVFVPEADRLGPEGTALAELKRHLPRERLSIAVTAAATAEAALSLTVDYCHERRVFGRPLGEHQGIRWQLAEMRTQVDVVRVFVDRCIEAQLGGELTAVDAAEAKLFATEVENAVADRCLQIHGGYGYMEEYPIARLWRDSRVQRIYGGTSEIMKEIIGRSMGFREGAAG